ncbi:MAG: hypothetical protein MZU91_11325 [Desulfosudis oleivorans]|nr:hypothetical protein [Desulfosudis oleivorans]
MERDLGGTKVIEATKPNENFPGGLPRPGHHAPDHLAEQSRGRNDRANDGPAARGTGRTEPGLGDREEPCGIQAYRDGVLLCRTVIMPYIGSGTGVPDLVTWRIGLDRQGTKRARRGQHQQFPWRQRDRHGLDRRHHPQDREGRLAVTSSRPAGA